MKVGCIGELVVDFICPDAVASIEAADIFEKHPGGSPANVTVALTQAGIDVTLLSRIGKEPFGWFVYHAIARAGCTTEGIWQDNAYPTRCVFMTHTSLGSRRVAIANRRSADQFLSWEEVQERDFIFDVLHIGGTTMLGEVTAKTTFELVQQVKEAGGLVSFDPNISLARVAPAVRNRTSKLLEMVDVLKVNEEEWEVVQTLQPELPTPALLVLTRGAAGATLQARQHKVNISSPDVDVVDVTGAGDAFYGGLLRTLILQNADFNELTTENLTLAGAAGRQLAGKVIRHRGGLLSIVSRQ